MNILHISTIMEWRGGDKQLLTTYNILKDEADTNHFIMCPKNSALEERCINGNIPFYSADRKSKFSKRFLKKIISVSKNENINLIHAHDSSALTLSLVAVKLLPDIKLVYTRKRNNRVKKNFLKKLKYNNSRITRMLCVSKAVKDVLLPVMKDKEKIEVIYDGIDVTKFKYESSSILRKEYNIDSDTLIIGNIAGLTAQKDLFTFLDCAAVTLKKSTKKLKFIIVGEGPLEAELKAYSQSLDIESKVIFTGFRGDIPKILPEFDFFLLSSKTEGLPLSVMEAFACRVPVIATAAGGTGEAVFNEKTGMLSPVGDAKALSKNLLKVIQDDNLRKEVIENAFRLLHERFTLDVMKKNYADFYKKLS